MMHPEKGTTDTFATAAGDHLPSRDRLLRVAMGAARQAGEILLHHFGSTMQIRSKGPRDIVTAADTAAEDAIIASIRHHFPEHDILAEESHPALGHAGRAGITWLVDPLDGTTNFARGIPYFCVSIAISERERPLAGVVYDPLREEMFHAIRGAGAFCNTTSLRRTMCHDPAEWLITFDPPRSEELRSRLWDTIADISSQIGGWRTFGSAALALCYVAAGRSDAYIHPSLQPWDVAAGGLLVEEAGGTITSLEGSRTWWRRSDCLACGDGHSHERLLRLLSWQGHKNL